MLVAIMVVKIINLLSLFILPVAEKWEKKAFKN
jgi:hypothetical protein